MQIKEVEQSYITAREAAMLMQVTPQRVRIMGGDHATFPKRAGILFGHTVFDRAAVLAWIEQHRRKP